MRVYTVVTENKTREKMGRERVQVCPGTISQCEDLIFYSEWERLSLEGFEQETDMIWTALL